MRDIRSTLGYIEGDFRTFAIDCGSVEFGALLRWAGGYDYVLNLSALKHVRSEKDPFTLMRMVDVNILNTIATLEAAAHPPCKMIVSASDRHPCDSEIVGELGSMRAFPETTRTVARAQSPILQGRV